MNRIQGAIDRRLSGLSFDAEMLRRLTLRAEALEGRVVQRRPGRTVLIAAAILLLLAVGALAAAMFSGSVDWFGNPVETESVEPTPRPTSADAAYALESRMADLSAEKPEDEIWYFRYASGKGEMCPAEETIAAHTDLQKRLKDAASQLAIAQIPVGYRYKKGSLQFYYTRENLKSLIPLGGEAPAEGMTLTKFRAGDALKACVSGYDAQYQDDEGHRLWVSANLDLTSTDRSFGLNEGENHEAVSIPGMKNALYIGDDGESTLYLLKTGIAPVSALDDFAPVSADPQDGAEIYDAIVYVLQADALGKDALEAMAKSMA